MAMPVRGFGSACEPWVRFCLRARYIQAASVLRRAREAEQIWVAVDERREARGLPERVVSSLFDAATGLRIRNAAHRKNVELTESVEISHQVAAKDLRAMVNAGLLSQRGTKRGTNYVAADRLVEVRDEIRAGRQPIEAGALFDI
jgi:hypothetical protein